MAHGRFQVRPGLPSSSANMCTVPGKVMDRINNSVSSESKELLGAVDAVKMKFWGRFGNRRLADLAAEISTTLRTDSKEVNAHCHLALSLAQQGKFEAGIDILQAQMDIHSGTPLVVLEETAVLVLLQRYTEQGDYRTCAKICNRLQQLNQILPSPTHLNSMHLSEIFVKSIYFQAMAYLQTQQYRKCFDYINKNKTFLYFRNEFASNLDILGMYYYLLLAKIFSALNNKLRHGSGLIAQALFSCLNACLVALTKSENYNSMEIYVEALLLLVELQVTLGLPAKALLLLDRFEIVIAQYGSAKISGMALLLRARALMEKDGEIKFEDALNILDKSEQFFTASGSVAEWRECCYFQAILCNHLKLIERRNLAAKNFKQLSLGQHKLGSPGESVRSLLVQLSL
eukprot:TRINITY_DN2113_c0_g1_i1.p1 TRINITY_DN2113_c0_g1~~TRINITY_DN2113_c0_g1_i1.p1  ORF type:complete len:442 (-),score=58.57 TRINITY_DN2113_c0_g1_i1:49-1251(-)